jgi:CTP synthase (UTP-ammonia lyase)
MHIVVLMDLPPRARYYTATVDALEHAAAMFDGSADVQVLGTDAPVLDAVQNADGIVIGPGSPYRDEYAVWDTVRSARERGVPLVGT